MTERDREGGGQRERGGEREKQKGRERFGENGRERSLSPLPEQKPHPASGETCVSVLWSDIGPQMERAKGRERDWWSPKETVVEREAVLLHENVCQLGQRHVELVFEVWSKAWRERERVCVCVCVCVCEYVCVHACMHVCV